MSTALNLPFWQVEVPGEEKWERGSIWTRPLAVHIVLQSGWYLREVDTAAHPFRSTGRVREGKSPSPVFFTCLFLQLLKFSDVLSAQDTKNCLWSLILWSYGPWQNSSGETQQASTEVNAALTPAQQPTGRYVHRNSSKSAGPWTWSTDLRSAVIEKKVWRRGENLFASWDQNKMFSIHLFTCWQDSARVH